MLPNVESIQVGRPQQFSTEGDSSKPWTSAIIKESVSGAVWLGMTTLDGDEQSDLIHHGGPDKAVLAYSAEHYPGWRRSMDNPLLPFGAFGENFTVAGLTETDVCIGDMWQVGNEAVVQVSQPRQPCWKLARRWRIKSLALEVQQTGRTGWYFRVLTEGMVAAGMSLTLRGRPYPDWTIERANRVMHAEKSDIAAALELGAIPLLSQNWRTTLTRRANKQEPDPQKRLIGENE